MGIMYYLLSPFTWILNLFYSMSQSYGISLLLFAVGVKLVLFPFSIKGKRSMIQMNMLSGRMQQLQKQYGKNPERYNQEMQKLYEKENVNPMSGCMWSLIPMFILLPLYAIIREPLHYMMALNTEQIAQVAQVLDWQNVAVANGWATAAQVADGFTSAGYNQLFLSSLINEGNLEAVRQALGSAGNVFAINFDFLGLNLALVPTWKIWEDFTMMKLGLLILVLCSVVSGLVMMLITTKTNQMNQDQAQNEQAKRTNRTMMLIQPVMSLWIGFIMPAGLCLYWIANNLLSMVQEVIAGRMLKKDYEAARIAAEQRAKEEKEEEKRRKAEAAEERARRLEEEKKNRGKKKSLPKKKEEDTPGVNRQDSQIGLRAYARGRAYIPDRFGGVTPYRDPDERIRRELAAQKQKKGKKAGQEEKPAEKPVEQPVEQTPVPPVSSEIPQDEINFDDLTKFPEFPQEKKDEEGE